MSVAKDRSLASCSCDLYLKKKKKQTLSYFANKRRQSFPLTSHRRLEAVQSRQPPGDTNKGLAQHRYDVAVLFD